jgi:hypothetical protein
MVQTLDQAGPVWFAPSKDIVFNGGGLDPNDVVQFLSPIQGIIYMSEQAVATALKLEARATATRHRRYRLAFCVKLVASHYRHKS